MTQAKPNVLTTLALPLLFLVCACTSSPRKQEPPSISPIASSAPSRRDPTHLRIAAWNIEWFNAKPSQGVIKRSLADCARLKRYADKLAPDVVALSEVDGPEAAARLFDQERFSFHFSRAGGAQRTGFAYRSSLPVILHPELDALAAGGLRSGTDLTIGEGKNSVRLLAVHLKSGCFAKPMKSGKACEKLSHQVPIIEEWIDQRTREGVAFAVLGDFNRILFPSGKEDAVWQEWNDNDPEGLKLWSPTSEKDAQCWNAKHPEFIDHIVMNELFRSKVSVGSFSEQLFSAADERYRNQLSDHCAISVELNWSSRSQTSTPGSNSRPVSEMPPPAQSTSLSPEKSPIKGNITRDGRKLYHSPDCPSYKETRIDESKGERYFLDASTAEAAGFQRASNCPQVLPP